MLTEAKKHLGLIKTYFKFNLSSSMEYRASFLIQTFGMIINNGTFIFFWWILFNNVGDIGGYGFKEVMTLWAIASAAYGISFVVFGNIRRLSQIIINGELDTYLLQPKDVLINVISSNTMISAWGDILYGLILFFGVYGFKPIEFSLYVVFCIMGALIFSSVLIFANSLTFFIGNSQGISGLFLEFMITFSIYPEGIYKGIVKFILFTIVPAGFVSLIPVRILRNLSWDSWPYFLSILGVVIVRMLFSYWFFNKGLKRYESGNLIVSKL